MSDAAEEKKEEAPEGGEEKKEEKKPASPYEAAVERIEGWLEDIDGGAGEDAKFEPNYEQVREEVGKLDSPRAEEVNWRLVFSESRDILQEKSKDLLIASHAAYAMHEVQGLEGLVDGMAMFAAMMEKYWDNAFPPKKRIRGRVGALVWYLDRVNILLPDLKVTAKDRPKLVELKAISDKFKEVVFEKFGDKSPAMGPLKDNVERVLMSVPEDKPKPKPKPKEPPKAAPQPKPSAAPATEPAAAPAPAAPAATMASAADMEPFLREVGKSLLNAGRQLRKEQPMSPTAYLMARTGLWLAVTDAPPVLPTGKTGVPPIRPETRNSLEALSAANNWPQLLEEAEDALVSHRLQLDLCRYSAQAMAALGGAYEPVLKVTNGLLAVLLARMPTLPRLACKDGSLYADQLTKEWLAEEILSGGGGGGGGGASGGGGKPIIPEKEAAEAKKLVGGGKVSEALKLYDKVAAEAPDERSRFQIRLAQADMCRKGGNTKVGEAIYASLYKEAEERNLERWEPGLVVDCLVGYVSCLRGNREKGVVTPEEKELYRRLAQLQPSLAVELGT